VLIAIAKKRLHLPNSLHEILQILSLTMFETIPINQLLTPTNPDKHSEFEPQQLSLSSEKRWDTTVGFYFLRCRYQAQKSGFFQVHLSKELHAFGMCWQCHSTTPLIQ
jgi:hypothetical protein